MIYMLMHEQSCHGYEDMRSKSVAYADMIRINAQKKADCAYAAVLSAYAKSEWNLDAQSRKEIKTV